MTTTQELIDYYANLLILQYKGKPRAYATIEAQVTPVIMPQVSSATVEQLTFAAVPTTGSFVLSYNGQLSAAINWNDLTPAIQAKVEAIPGLSAVTVLGSIASGSLLVVMTGVTPPVLEFVVTSNTLSTSFFDFCTYSALATGEPFNSYAVYVLNWPWLTYAHPSPAIINVTVSILENETMPVAVENAFNLTGAVLAQGVQMDVVGKYAGVTRSGDGFTAPITLDDNDFLSLIRMAVVRNSAGSSLSEIQAFLHGAFGAGITVYDYQSMRMTFLISSAVGSVSLVQLFITEGLLPVPMGVAYAVIYSPTIAAFFGFRTYAFPAINSKPFNQYSSYQTNWPWLSYANSIKVF